MTDTRLISLALSRYSKDLLKPRERKLKHLDVRGYAIKQLYGKSGKKKVCDGDFCCHLEYETPGLHEKFFMLAKNGFRPVGNRVDMAVQVSF